MFKNQFAGEMKSVSEIIQKKMNFSAPVKPLTLISG